MAIRNPRILQIASKLYLIYVKLEHVLCALTFCAFIGVTHKNVRRLNWEQIWEAIFAG